MDGLKSVPFFKSLLFHATKFLTDSKAGRLAMPGRWAWPK